MMMTAVRIHYRHGVAADDDDNDGDAAAASADAVGLDWW